MAAEKQSKISTRKGGARQGAGRPRGARAKTTTALKDAILLAAAEVGEDNKGKGKLTGYLRRVAKNDLKAFSGLLGKVLPLQIAGPNGGPIPLASVDLLPEQKAQLVERMLAEY